MQRFEIEEIIIDDVGKCKIMISNSNLGFIQNSLKKSDEFVSLKFTKNQVQTK